jgi:hypothetical protein
MLRPCQAFTLSLIKETTAGVFPRAVAVVAVIAAFAAVAQPAYAAPPSNDTPSGATLISTLPFSDSVTIDEATTDSLDATLNAGCGAPATEGSVWYRLDATEDATVVFDVSQSSFSAGALVTVGDPANGTVLTCGPRTIGFSVTAGQTYYIMAFSDTPGVTTGTLVVNAETAVVLDVTVNPTGSFNPKTGSATISGTLQCSGETPNFAFVSVDLRQTVGRFTINGSGSIDAACTGTPQPWSVEVFPFNATKFSGGKAVSVTFAFACGNFTCGSDYEETTVRLQGKGK